MHYYNYYNRQSCKLKIFTQKNEKRALFAKASCISFINLYPLNYRLVTRKYKFGICAANLTFPLPSESMDRLFFTSINVMVYNRKLRIIVFSQYHTPLNAFSWENTVHISWRAINVRTVHVLLFQSKYR